MSTVVSDSNSPATHERTVLPAPGPDAGRIRATIVIGVALLLAGVVALSFHSGSKTNQVALSDSAKPVSTQRAQAGTFRPVHNYVGTIEAWNTAKVGPQFVS